MRFLRAIVARFRAWHRANQVVVLAEPALDLTYGPMIYRDVSAAGVRVYSLCGGCGARLECSATLCEECARGPHTSTF